MSVTAAVSETALEKYGLGKAAISGMFAAVGQSQWLAYLRRTMGARLPAYGLTELDGSAIRLSAPRGFTQEIARHIFELREETGAPRYAGIYYLSKLGDEIENWALFQRTQTVEGTLIPVGSAALEALERLDLGLVCDLEDSGPDF